MIRRALPLWLLLAAIPSGCRTPGAAATEPTIQGKPASQWLHAAAGGDLADRAHARDLLAGAEEATTFLVAHLGDPDPDLRDASAEVLASKKDRLAPAIPTIAAALRNADPDVRKKAARLLAGVRPQGVAALLGVMRSGAPEERLAALDALASAGDEARFLRGAKPLFTSEQCSEALESVVPFLREGAPLPRRRAAQLLAALGPKAAPRLPLLIPLFSDPDPDVRSSAIKAVQAVGDAAVDALLKAAGGGDIARRTAAITCLGGIKGERKDTNVVAALAKALGDTDTHVRATAIDAYVRWQHDGAKVVEALAASLADAELRVRGAAIEALQPGPGTVDAKVLGSHASELLGPIEQLFSDPALRVISVRACETLAAVAAPVMPELEELLDDGDPDMRHAALRALGSLAQAAAPAVPAIARLLDDTDARVRFAALDTLGAVGAPAEKAVPGVLEMLREAERSRSLGNPDYERAAGKTLARLGEAGEGALARALASTDPDLRHGAVVASEAAARRSSALHGILTSIAKDDADDAIRRAARETLERLAKPEDEGP